MLVVQPTEWEYQTEGESSPHRGLETRNAQIYSAHTIVVAVQYLWLLSNSSGKVETNYYSVNRGRAGTKMEVRAALVKSGSRRLFRICIVSQIPTRPSEALKSRYRKMRGTALVMELHVTAFWRLPRRRYVCKSGILSKPVTKIPDVRSRPVFSVIVLL